MKNEIEITADGSATIYVPHLDEHYHSVKGALTESLHIFRDCAFLHHQASEVPLRVLEIGFGTGLNAVVTAMAASEQHKAHYISLELYPVDDEICISARALGDVNVQEILEKLGGGGHSTVAGAQIKNKSFEQIRLELVEAIGSYLSANEEGNK